MQSKPQIKKSKSEQLNKQIMKLYFNGGKKKKLRAVDFVGTIAKINGVNAEDIGIISIEDTVSYVENPKWKRSACTKGDEEYHHKR